MPAPGVKPFNVALLFSEREVRSCASIGEMASRLWMDVRSAVFGEVRRSSSREETERSSVALLSIDDCV